MRIRVADLTEDGLLIEENLDPAQMKDLAVLQKRASCLVQGMLAVRLQIVPTAGMFQVKGRVEGKAAMTCSRCLGSIQRPLRSSFRLTFSRTIPGEGTDFSKDSHELQADELGVVLFEGDEIDFLDVIQEQIIMAIPMQPLCREDCRGLCARCGANLNEGPCRCPGEDMDPRLAILKQIKLD